MENTKIINNYNSTQLKISIGFFGESYAGKTCLLGRFFTGTYKMLPPTVIPTTTLFVKQIKIKDKDISLTVNFIDTPGQSRYLDINKIVMKNLQGIVLVYDITALETFNTLKTLISVANECNCSPSVLIGLKLDLENERVIKKEEALAFAKINGMKYFEVSALNGDNVNQLFDDIISYIVEKNTSLII